MKTPILLSVMLLLFVANAQASIIALKDGRTITGKIVQQDKNKVVVSVDGTSLTYYRDEIVSIKEEAAPAEENNASDDTDKEKLVQQYMALFPLSDSITKWVESNVPVEDRQNALALLLNDRKHAEYWAQLREQELLQSFTTSALKAAIDFYSSSDGKLYIKQLMQYRSDIISKYSIEMNKEVRGAGIKSRSVF